MQRKSNIHGETPKHKKLSIQFSLDGFSFCVSDIVTKNTYALVTYSFDVRLPSPQLLLERVTQLFANEMLLHQDFEEIVIIHQNNLSTLVPNAFFDEESDLKRYLDLNIKTLANDYITFDDIISIEAKTVYVPFVNINNYLFQNFGEFNFKHHSSVLIEKLIHFSKNNTCKQLFVNVSAKNIDIVVTKGTDLILYNAFAFDTKEDFIYYILFVAEQLQLNPNEIQLTFLGEIDESSENYKITYNYIRNINFIENSNYFLTVSDDFLNHSNYTLVS